MQSKYFSLCVGWRGGGGREGSNVDSKCVYVYVCMSVSVCVWMQSKYFSVCVGWRGGEGSNVDSECVYVYVCMSASLCVCLKVVLVLLCMGGRWGGAAYRLLEGLCMSMCALSAGLFVHVCDLFVATFARVFCKASDFSFQWNPLVCMYSIRASETEQPLRFSVDTWTKVL